MIKITKFLKGKIDWIDFIILIQSKKKEFEEKHSIVFVFTFPLGRPSSLRISNMRFSVLPEANVLLILNIYE